MFEYKVVPAPVKGLKAKGVKGAEARFALAVEQAINTLAADGWEYVRTDVLPSEERQGLTGSVTQWRNLMVFRRSLAPDVAAPAEIVAPPARVEPTLTAVAMSSAAADGNGIANSARDPDNVAEAVPEPGNVAEAVPEPDHVAEAMPEFEEGAEETRPA